MGEKTLLSLFDESGKWSEPFYKAGWEVIQWDLKIDEFMDINNFTDYETTMEIIDTGYYDIQGVIGGPPCTDFTISGNQYWEAKDASGQTEKSLELARQMLRLADAFRPTDPDYFDENPDSCFFWSLEQPVGRLGRLLDLGEPLIFQPHQFAGWLDLTDDDLARLDRIRRKNGNNVSDEDNEFVLRCNAYKKRTCLWGEFNHNMIIKNVEPVRTCKAGSPLMRLGGKSDKTKEERSVTPMGFAQAFYEANKNFKPLI